MLLFNQNQLKTEVLDLNSTLEVLGDIDTLAFLKTTQKSNRALKIERRLDFKFIRPIRIN